ncbi:alpha-tocopherol transfer protein-like isoform X1 [Bemisia tabaci]|uniref:alpha-tocopherol transfer protein-like isoform X1 n=1 Tax=Bemisia tabaci TaxID=7038 RepID=UPI003B27E611
MFRESKNTHIGTDPRLVIYERGKAGIKLEDDPIGPESALVAERELRETPERIRESCEQLRALMKEHRLVFREDDDFLLTFLRPTKYYSHSALDLMRRIVEFRIKNASVLHGLIPKDEEDGFLNNRVVNVLRDRDQHGRRIMVIQCGADWNPRTVKTDQLFRMLYLIHLAAIQEPETQVKGAIIIMDFHGMSMTQATHCMNLTFVARLLTFIQDAMPLRLKQVHIVKQPFIFQIVWNVFKPFIREKLRNRLFFHGSKMSSLHKFIEPNYLPEDYGGSRPKIDYSSADWFPVLNEIEEDIKEWSSFGYLPEGQPGNAETAQDSPS